MNERRKRDKERGGERERAIRPVHVVPAINSDFTVIRCNGVSIGENVLTPRVFLSRDGTKGGGGGGTKRPQTSLMQMHINVTCTHAYTRAHYDHPVEFNI